MESPQKDPNRPYRRGIYALYLLILVVFVGLTLRSVIQGVFTETETEPPRVEASP